MKEIKKMCIFIGDIRQKIISELIGERGIEVTVNRGKPSKEDLAEYDSFLLPVPVTRDGYRLNTEDDILLMELFEALPHGCVVIGGKIPQFFADHLFSKNIQICDFYKDEDYIWKNAKITAEGALELMMKSCSASVNEIKVLVCGFGRIGKCLSRMLKLLGAGVTVAARKKEALSEASVLYELNTVYIDPSYPEKFHVNERYDFVFNTVPSKIFDENNVFVLENAVYVELASDPFGGDSDLIERYCRKYILASGLPGKYAPESDARAVYKVISKHIFGEVYI